MKLSEAKKRVKWLKDLKYRRYPHGFEKVWSMADYHTAHRITADEIFYLSEHIFEKEIKYQAIVAIDRLQRAVLYGIDDEFERAGGR